MRVLKDGAEARYADREFHRGVVKRAHGHLRRRATIKVDTQWNRDSGQDRVAQAGGIARAQRPRSRYRVKSVSNRRGDRRNFAAAFARNPRDYRRNQEGFAQPGRSDEDFSPGELARQYEQGARRTVCPDRSRLFSGQPRGFQCARAACTLPVCERTLRSPNFT